MEKIVIIKLGALGDVVRTLPILLGLKEKFPDSEITWITKPNAESIVEQSKHVDRVLTTPLEITEEFDKLYNFDIDKEATDLADKISAKEKKGFYMEDDFIAAFNLNSEYYLSTIFDDELKKSNTKTYQQMMFEAAELDYQHQHHGIDFSPHEDSYAQNFLKENNLTQDRLIGIHIGSSSRWPSKKWHNENLEDFLKQASTQGYKLLLLAGPNEIEEVKKIKNELAIEGIKIPSQDPSCSIMEFASLVNLCKIIISADSLALHISLALKKPTIGLFFVTSYSEVEDYNLLKKIIAPKHSEFFPEKSDQYSKELVKSISTVEVLEVVDTLQNNKQ
ncbi:glycosyltransferase family 9 protein [archaeon]|jgi:ADP-heptose:LPS heptosyltransferase|nr:glycosyltransferase family 9 protein [archaeon]MBT4373117.1 glycosyltransferase family 9 protein [archaeon]MBT4531462.1 glycosyltransferase family 9 protein [archaeon]MBT7001360.1 glycosyltransferase family 9 protein [archaeon]MBT7282154.1 glycosyltransferase family 9 protein [archaeon]